MSSLVILFGGFACLFLGYVTYGSWLSKQWGVDNSKPTPAHTMQDGVEEYVVPGAALGSGIWLNNQFIGTGYDTKLRLLGDYGSQLYVITPWEEISQENRSQE